MYDLYLFDKDQTLTSPFAAWAYAGEKAMRDVSASRAAMRGLDEDAFFEMMMTEYHAKRIATQNDEAPFKVTTWYWHFENLIENLSCLQPLNDVEETAFADIDATICKTYEDERKNGVKAFDGISYVIETLAASNARMAVISDGRIGEIAHSVDKLDVPFHHFAAVACWDNEKEDPEHMTLPNKTFFYEGKKPGLGCVAATLKLIEEFHLTKGAIVVIGDNKTDAVLSGHLKKHLAKTDIAVDFAWAKYGAALNERAVWFANDFLADPYRLGIEANETGIRAAGIVPDHILNEPLDILRIGPR